MNAAHTRNAAYTRSTAAALVRCPDSVPPKYFSNKNAQHPAECAGQQRLNFEDLLELDFTQNPGKVMDDIAFVRSHWWLVSEGFSLSTANSDVQKLPATLYHRIADSLAYAA